MSMANELAHTMRFLSNTMILSHNQLGLDGWKYFSFQLLKIGDELGLAICRSRLARQI